MNKKTLSVLTLITTLILCCFASFGTSAAQTGETTTVQSGAGSIADAVQGALSDSGISDAVNDVLGGIQENGGISDVVGGISDRISGSLDDYSSMLDGILNGSSGTQNTTSAQVTQSFGNFAVGSSPAKSNIQSRVTLAETTASETTTAPATVAPETTTVQPTTAPEQDVTSVAAVTKPDDSKGSGIWIFTAIVAAIIMVVVVTLIAVTGRTEFNSRVYDKSTIKSVRKTSASEVEFDDDEPMDNIMYVGASDKKTRDSRG